MKSAILILIIYLVFFMGATVNNAYCEDSKSSGVIVIGPSEKSATQSASDTADASKISQLADGPGDSSKIKITGSELAGSSRIIYEIRGSRIGGVQVSEGLSLPADAIIISVDAGMGRAFTIMKVGEEKKETLFLNVSPEHAIGQKLPKGTYKVYPLDPDGKFMNEKLTARVQVGLAGNDVMDPRARWELYKTEKEQ